MKEKNYECDKCSFRSFNKLQLAGHMTSNHMKGKLPSFNCTLCGQAFHRRETMNIHIKVKHQGAAKICKFKSLKNFLIKI